MFSDNMQIRLLQSVLNTMHREVSIAADALDSLLESGSFSLEGLSAINTAKLSLKKDLKLITSLFNAGCDPKILYKNKKSYNINLFFSQIASTVNNTYAGEGNLNISFSSSIDKNKSFYVNSYAFEHMIYAILFCLFCYCRKEEPKDIKIKLSEKVSEKNSENEAVFISVSSEGDAPNDNITKLLKNAAIDSFDPSEIGFLNLFTAQKNILSLGGKIEFKRTGEINKFSVFVPKESVSLPKNHFLSGEPEIFLPDARFISEFFSDIFLNEETSLSDKNFSRSLNPLKNLPYEVYETLSALEQRGFSAYLTGGSVRDILLGQKPRDYDISTSATCEEIKEVFAGQTIIPTGEEFGTLTVINHSLPIEITSFRRDGKYENNRSPKEVFFTTDIKEDLKRRDFSVNSMALSKNGEITDIFGGKEDLENKILRTVGDPNERFSEDALRILRALRFSASKGFEIENKTKTALFVNKKLLLNISAERITAELKEILCGENSFGVLSEYKEIFSVIIPELAPCFSYGQNNPYHIHDVYTHSITALKNAPRDFSVRLALLLHDIKKPDCKTEDENGYYHFKGHAALSAAAAETILKRLKLDKKTAKEVITLIKYHSYEIKPDKPSVKKLISFLGEDLSAKLFKVKLADESAKRGIPTKRAEETEKAYEVFKKIVQNEECYSVKNLKINGNILKEIGFSGKEIGKVLNILLSAVMNEEIKNEETALISYTKSLKNKNI